MIGVRLPNSALDAKETRDFAHAVELEPSPMALQKLVVHLVERGELAEARHWIEVARQVTPLEPRRNLAMYWQYLSARDPKYAQVQWPE